MPLIERWTYWILHSLGFHLFRRFPSRYYRYSGQRSFFPRILSRSRSSRSWFLHETRQEQDPCQRCLARHLHLWLVSEPFLSFFSNRREESVSDDHHLAALMGLLVFASIVAVYAIFALAAMGMDSSYIIPIACKMIFQDHPGKFSFLLPYPSHYL